MSEIANPDPFASYTHLRTGVLPALVMLGMSILMAQSAFTGIVSENSREGVIAFTYHSSLSRFLYWADTIYFLGLAIGFLFRSKAAIRAAAGAPVAYGLALTSTAWIGSQNGDLVRHLIGTAMGLAFTAFITVQWIKLGRRLYPSPEKEKDVVEE